MSPSKKSEPGEKKKKKPGEAGPRPGTMAHLRQVEVQKRLKKEQEKPQGAPPPEPAARSVPGASITVANQEAHDGVAGDGNAIKAHMIIHGAAALAGAVGGGLAQIPASGSLAITPIQISMTIALGTLHGKSLDKSSALAILAAAYGPYVGRTVSQLFVGLIPGVGNVIRGATAFVVTESIGWAAYNILSNE